VFFEVRGGKQYFDGIFDMNAVKGPKNIFSKGGNTKGLVLSTPPFVGVLGDISIKIQPDVDPSKMVDFVYTVEDVQLAVVSVIPSRGIIGTRILLKIDYFSYPTEVFVRLNDMYLVPDDHVEILQTSNRLMTLINIRWANLSQPSGTHRVSVAPKTCSHQCAESVRFTFEELDASRPELVSPIPMSGYFQKGLISPVYLQLKETDKSTISRIVVYFENRTLSDSVDMNTTMDTNPVAGNVGLDIRIAPAFLHAAQGPFTVTIGFEFTVNSGRLPKNTTAFLFSVYDGLQTRVVKIQPQPVPTSTIISGRKIQVNSVVTVTGSNFPQDVKKDETVAMLNNKGAIVLQFEHTVSCSPSAYDCNRTQIVLQLPEVISPGAQKLVLSRRGQNPGPVSLEMDIVFEPPCPDYDLFCQNRGLIANFKAFEDKPTVECSTVYCISTNSIGAPRVLDFSPKEGSRSGGTEVTVRLKDLPAFSDSEVTVTVEGSKYVETAQVLALQQSAQSTWQVQHPYYY
jgi:hypothetical protein